MKRYIKSDIIIDLDYPDTGLRVSKDQKDAERIRYEKIKDGGFNPLAEI